MPLVQQAFCQRQRRGCAVLVVLLVLRVLQVPTVLRVAVPESRPDIADWRQAAAGGWRLAADAAVLRVLLVHGYSC